MLAPADFDVAKEEILIKEAPVVETPAPKEQSVSAVSIEKVTVPDLGGASGVEVIEINVAVGGTISQDDTLLVLEALSDSMEIPSPFAGTVKTLFIKLGDKIDEGALIAELEIVNPASIASPDQPQAVEKTIAQPTEKKTPQQKAVPMPLPVSQAGGEVYAGPAVRLMRAS